MQLSELDPNTVVEIHDDIVREYADSDATATGVRDNASIESALHLAQHYPAERAEPIRIAAFMASLVSNHPFVDANKRTALNTGAALFAMRGRDLRVTHDIGLILKVLGIDRRVIDLDGLADYLSTHQAMRDEGEASDLRQAAAWHRNRYRDLYDWLEEN